MSASSLVFLPQTGAARLISRVLDSNGALACIARIPLDSPFRSRNPSDKRVPTVIAVEMAAQAAAALEPAPGPSEGVRQEGGGPRLLVGLRAIRLLASHLNADDEFTCRATPMTSSGPLRIYGFEVLDPSGEVIADGELSTYFDSDSAPV